MYHVAHCSNIGHSCSVLFSIDGDGADRFDVKDRQLLSKPEQIVNRKCEYGVEQAN